jgi:hypothetical protein
MKQAVEIGERDEHQKPLHLIGAEVLASAAIDGMKPAKWQKQAANHIL